MESNEPPPLPKRPSKVQSEPAGPVTKKTSTDTVPNSRIPARPAPPKPGSRPASVHVPHKDASSFRSVEKSNGSSVNKRKIEITILDARPMSEINFRDTKSSDPKPPASPKGSSCQAESQTLAKQAESSKISGPDSTSTQSSPPAHQEENISSPPQPPSDAVMETQKSLPPRPKRPTIIRPIRSEKTEKENMEKLPSPFTKTNDQDDNDNVPPQKPTRLSKIDSPSEKVDTFENDSSSSGPQINQSHEQEKPQSELEHPVVSARPKRPTIIRPGKSVVQDGDKPLTGQKDEDRKIPPLPSRPPLPSSAPSASVPPPLPSKSPASPPSNPTTFQAEPTKDSPKAPRHPSDGQPERKPVPKPRPRSVAVSSNIDVLSLASKNESKDFPLGGSNREKVMLRSSSPPPLPIKAPRAASSLSEDKSSSGINSLEKADTTTSSHDLLKENEKSQEKSGPTRPKPPLPATSRNSQLPARPPPPGRKTATPHSRDESDQVLVMNNEKKSQQSNKTSSSGFVSETKDKFTDKEDEEGPVYAKINKTTKKFPLNQPKETIASEVEADQEKTNEFPFKFKLKSTLDPSEKNQDKEKNSESSTIKSEPGENQQGPRISPKPKPKPSLKPKPQPPTKPKPTTISPRELEGGKMLEAASSKSQKPQDKEMPTSPVAEDKISKSPKMSIHGGKKGEEQNINITFHEKEENEPTISDREVQDSNAGTVNDGVKKTGPRHNQGQAVKQSPLLPPKLPDIKISQEVTNKENVSKSDNSTVKESTFEEKSLSTQNTMDSPPKDKQSSNLINVDSSSDAVQNNSEEKDTSHIAPAEASSMPPRKKPVRIIGFPQKRSSMEKKTSDVDEGTEDLSVSERCSLPPKPPPPAARPPPPRQISMSTSNSTTSMTAEDKEKHSEPPIPVSRQPPLNRVSPSSSVTSSTKSTTDVSLKDEEKHSEPPIPVSRQPPLNRVSPSSSVTSSTKSTTDVSLKDEEKHSEPPAPVARPPPPSRVTPSSTISKSNSSPDVKVENEERHSRTSLQGTLHSEESEPVTPETTNEKPASQDAVKPPKARPPPPRPASIARRKTSESDGTDSNHNVKKHERLTEKLSSHQPNQPSPGGCQKTKSGPPTLPPRPGIGHILYNYIANQPHGIASHDYKASQPDELSFQAGETVLLTKQVDDQWMAGRVGNTEGIFPKAFVEIKCPLETQGLSAPIPDWQDSPDAWPYDIEPAEEKPDTLTGPRCRARFDFEGCGEGELALEDGDVIKLLSRVGNEWLRGKLHDKEGIFPAAFVEVIEDLPEDQESSKDSDSTEIVAIFDFEGQEGDLAFQAGDKIQVMGQISSEWLYGESNGLKGQFPVSFISFVPPCLPKIEPSSMESKDNDTNTTSSVDLSHQTSEIPLSTEKVPLPVIASCVALHDYESNTPGDLQFKSGETIEIVEFMGEDWLSGRLHGEEGIFPKVFVEMADFLSPAAEKRDDVPLLGKAVHSFSGRDDTELSFEEGSIIELEEFVDESQEWRWGTLQGHRGMFPSNFVELIG